MFTRATAGTGGVFNNVSDLGNSSLRIDTIVRLVTGQQYVVKTTNLGKGVVLANGYFANPIGDGVVVPQTGGGLLIALVNNEFRDGGTYFIPLASSVPIDHTITMSLPDVYSGSTPLAQCLVGDSVTDSVGPDTEILFDSGSIAITLTSDGVSDWRL